MKHKRAENIVKTHTAQQLAKWLYNHNGNAFKAFSPLLADVQNPHSKRRIAGTIARHSQVLKCLQALTERKQRKGETPPLKICQLVAFATARRMTA